MDTQSLRPIDVDTFYDPYFRITVLSSTPNPQRICYADMHQCYSSSCVGDEFEDSFKDPFGKSELTEKEAGERVVRICLKQRHFGIIESPQINLSVGYFPHSFVQQLRTHRIGCTFNVQSFRYTSDAILKVAEGVLPVDEVFYSRPVGTYVDRKGAPYYYSEELKKIHQGKAVEGAKQYSLDVLKYGLSEEHARENLPFSLRQHLTCSFNLRSLFHVLDMRTPKDAQLEIRVFCQMLWPYVEAWVPEIAAFYKQSRWAKNNLAP